VWRNLSVSGNRPGEEKMMAGAGLEMVESQISVKFQTPDWKVKAWDVEQKNFYLQTQAAAAAGVNLMVILMLLSKRDFNVTRDNTLMMFGLSQILWDWGSKWDNPTNSWLAALCWRPRQSITDNLNWIRSNSNLLLYPEHHRLGAFLGLRSQVKQKPFDRKEILHQPIWSRAPVTKEWQPGDVGVVMTMDLKDRASHLFLFLNLRIC